MPGETGRIRALPYAAAALATLGCVWFFGRAAWLVAKASLAQLLIAGAWAETLAGADAVRPWPWADTWPVARLITPGGRSLYVLADGHGQALAFGPGRLPGSRRPGEGGPVVVAGHRDSHFAFLRRLERGQIVSLEDFTGRLHHYRVARLRVADSRRERLLLPEDEERLVLVTCYPFDALTAGGPLRYVVSALPIPGGNEEENGGEHSAH